MTKLLSLIALLLVVISAHSKSSVEPSTRKSMDGITSLKVEDASLNRMTAFILLTEIKYSLQEIYTPNSKTTSNFLLDSSHSEEHKQIRKELKDYTDIPKFEVVGTSLYIDSKNGRTELAVDNVIEGRFRINGKKIRIQPHMSYGNIKSEIGGLDKNSNYSHPLFDLMVPKAHALLPVAAVAACIRFCIPAVVIAGKTIVKYGKPVSSFIGKALMNPYVHATYFICGMTGGQFWGENCFALAAKGMCYVGMDGKCVKSTDTANAELQADIVDKDTETEIEVKEEDDGACRAHADPNGTRFTKELTVKVNKKKKAESEPTTLIAKSNFLVEYRANPAAPGKLLISSITETLTSKNGKPQGQRIWKSDGETFKVTYLNALQMSVPTGFIEKPKEIVCKDADLKKDECQSLIKHFNNLGPHLNCPFENPDAVVNKLKEETKQIQRAK